MSRSRPRRGFTLIEHLVVIAINDILIALLLPAVQQAREAARRSQCQNNLKQIGLAMHNYHDTHKVFPPGFIGGTGATGATPATGWAWGTFILPFMDQAPLYNQLQPGVTSAASCGDGSLCPSDANRLALLRTGLPAFVCPSDPHPSITENPGNGVCAVQIAGAGSTYRIGLSNYIASANANGSIDGTYTTTYNGMFFSNSRTRVRDITDGTSNTMMMMERHTRVAGGASGTNEQRMGGNWAGLSYPNSNTYYAYQVLGCIRPTFGEINGSASRWDSRDPSSFHEGGIQILLADGAVRFLSENVNTTTSYNLINIRDGQVLGEF